MKLQNLKISCFDLVPLSLDDLPVSRAYIKSDLNDILFDLSSVLYNGFSCPCKADLINKTHTHPRTGSYYFTYIQYNLDTPFLH